MKKQYLFKILVLLPLVLFISSYSNKVQLSTTDQQNVYTILSSKSWNWKHKGCSENRQRFFFEGNKMTIKYDNPIKRENVNEYVNKTVYLILEKKIDNGIRTKIVDEYRKDNSGQLVEWDLILENDSTFYWRRSDWSASSMTIPLIACD